MEIKGDIRRGRRKTEARKAEQRKRSWSVGKTVPPGFYLRKKRTKDGPRKTGDRISEYPNRSGFPSHVPSANITPTRVPSKSCAVVPDAGWSRVAGFSEPLSGFCGSSIVPSFPGSPPRPPAHPPG